MKILTYSRILTKFCFIILLASCSSSDDGGISTVSVAQEADGLVVMEAENTVYTHTQWALRNASNPGRSGPFGPSEEQTFEGSLEGYVGNGYLEYTGEDSFREPSDTSMFYSFRITNPGTYYLFFRAFENHTFDPETEDGELFAGDRNNDAFVRMEGNFQANTDYTRDGDRFGATLDELTTFNKLFCSSGDNEPSWGRSIALEPNDFKEPVYQFEANETYQLYIIGRSSQLGIDRIYLVRLLDENGQDDVENVYAYNQFRRDVEDGLYEESVYVNE